MTVPNNPGAHGYGGEQPGFNDQQVGGYQQTPQQGWAPSAYSAPAPGQEPYGYAPQGGYVPQGYGAPQPAAGFASIFSTNFSIRATPAIAKIVQILALVVGAAFMLNGLFELIGRTTLNTSAMYTFGGVIHLLSNIALGLFIPAITRVILEGSLKSDEQPRA